MGSAPWALRWPLLHHVLFGPDQFLASQLRHTKGLPVFKGTRKDEALYANTSPVNSSGTSGTKYQQLWEIQDYLEGYGP